MPLFVFVVLAMVGFWGWSLIDIVGRSKREWVAIGQERWLWLVAVALVGLPASLVYFAWLRPKLSRVGALPPAAYPMLSAAPAGWYPDPQGMPLLRWFDGYQWTAQTTPAVGIPIGPHPMTRPPATPAPGTFSQNYPYPPA